MKTKAKTVRKNDLRLEEFDLPSINDDEISKAGRQHCMSSYKALIQEKTTNAY